MTERGQDDGALESSAAATRVLERLRQLAAELDPLERSVLAALVGPGVARLVRSETVDGLMDWTPEALPDALTAVARRHPRSITVDPSP